MTLIMYSSGVSPDGSTAALASAVALLTAPFGRPAPVLLPPRGIFDFSDCTIVYHLAAPRTRVISAASEYAEDNKWLKTVSPKRLSDGQLNPLALPARTNPHLCRQNVVTCGPFLYQFVQKCQM
jgi:hypothetical protein